MKKVRDGVYGCGENIVFVRGKIGRRTVINRDNTQLVKELLKESPTSTLESVRKRLDENDIVVGRTTVHRMDRMGGLTHQMISYKPSVVFTPRITQARFEYAEEVLDIPDEELWFLDESGFNLHLAPARCWSDRGRTPVHAVPANRGTNVSLLMCIGHDGIKFHEMKVGAYNSNEFVVFLQGLAVRFPEVLRGEVCLVMDNARIHHAQTARNFLVENGIRHIYLPPYSPDLNPIENVFGALKKRYTSRGVVRTQAQMMRRIDDVIDEINMDYDMETFYGRMRRFVDLALNRESFY